MKLLARLLILIAVATSCTPKATTPDAGTQNVALETEYDSLLAVELGADDWGMRRYVMAFLKTGPNRPADSATAVDLQKAHMENINRLAEEGKLVLAGPFLGKDSLRGIYVFDVQSIEEAKALTETDPAIQFGSLVMELHPWYGSAALKKVNSLHQRLEK
ncbi:MAG: YciI family protein [Bacteroidales bacterium]|jgi:uncharacterized protein YciI|nr:YciI family protein [Bacteroidales bacterium]MDD2570331.1 YciI family protein [Bacteroidales bacterium]MDD2812061.1 YciI family protein [Bacteroidales bacterium]MDD3385220.1 YciI family protein [Bacteroidales bacterium]MDD3811442.1 YciI family protein [Bacteroidales bacterium]